MYERVIHLSSREKCPPAVGVKEVEPKSIGVKRRRKIALCVALNAIARRSQSDRCGEQLDTIAGLGRMRM